MDYDEWHTPYIQDDELIFDIEDRKKISVARCARVSYLTHDGKRDPQEDLDLFQRLVDADIMHASPLEHVATPFISPIKKGGNFYGWCQMRQHYEAFDKPFVPNHPLFKDDPTLIKYQSTRS